MSNIVDLIARLEAAKEGCWELDQAIALLPTFLGVSFEDGEYPPFTISLDAAVLLVPPDMLPMTMVTFSTPAKAGAHDGSKEYLYFEGATPALALCIAALKARDDRDRDAVRGERA